MKKRRQIWTSIFLCLALLILILDAKTSVSGAKDGIVLCLYTVIPSLFPFIILSTMINSRLLGRPIPVLSPICKVCGIPDGAESILLLGFLGGYPVGAKSVYDAYSNKTITKNDAQRMLGFCNNAGPAFIFGMLSHLFSNPYCVWALWSIHIFSAILVGILLPGKSNNCCRLTKGKPITIAQAMDSTIRTMALICGWVLTFRIIISFCKKWFLWLFPEVIQLGITGILELSNGCHEIIMLTSESMRFLLCSVLLGFGGICVAMQTLSVTKDLRVMYYFPGKLLQGLISFLTAYTLQLILFAPNERCVVSPFLLAGISFCVIIPTFLIKHKKDVAIRQNLVYNGGIT